GPDRAHRRPLALDPAQLALPGRIDQRCHAVRDLLRKGDDRLGPVDALDLQNAVQHLLEVVVAAGHDPAQQVVGAGGGVGLEDLGDLPEVGHDVAESALGDVDGGEGEDAVAHRPHVEMGCEAGDDPAADEPVDMALGRTAGHAGPPGDLEHADAGPFREHPQYTPVHGVEGLGHEPDSTVRGFRLDKVSGLYETERCRLSILYNIIWTC